MYPGKAEQKRANGLKGRHRNYTETKERHGIENNVQDWAKVIQPELYWAEIKQPGAHHPGRHSFPSKCLLRTPKLSKQDVPGAMKVLDPSISPGL